jgi:uncharacterized protein YbjT (DUF2867 family)
MDDVGAAAVACLAQPEEHNGQTYRLGYQAATYHDIARIFTEVIGQPFSYEARPPEEFYRNVLAAGVLDLAHLYAAQFCRCGKDTPTDRHYFQSFLNRYP